MTVAEAIAGRLAGTYAAALEKKAADGAQGLTSPQLRDQFYTLMKREQANRAQAQELRQQSATAPGSLFTSPLASVPGSSIPKWNWGMGDVFTSLPAVGMGVAGGAYGTRMPANRASLQANLMRGGMPNKELLNIMQAYNIPAEEAAKYVRGIQAHISQPVAGLSPRAYEPVLKDVQKAMDAGKAPGLSLAGGTNVVRKAQGNVPGLVRALGPASSLPAAAASQAPEGMSLLRTQLANLAAKGKATGLHKIVGGGLGTMAGLAGALAVSQGLGLTPFHPRKLAPRWQAGALEGQTGELYKQREEILNELQRRKGA